MSLLRSETSRLHLPFLGLAIALVLSGCQAPQPQSERDKVSFLGSGEGKKVMPPPPIEADQVDTRDDIVAIHQFWRPLPWRMADGRAVGFSVPTYFISSETEKGTFVSGKILVWLYEIVRLRDGTTDKQCVHVWEFDRAAAMGYRVRKLAVMGYYYGFALTWPPNVDVAGKPVEIVFGYERADGRVVTSAPRRESVPAPATEPLARGRMPEAAPRAAPAPRPRAVEASPEMRDAVRARLRALEEGDRGQGSATMPDRTDD